jgi:hypothetical protein
MMLLSIRIHDSEVLVSVGEIFGDAFHESIEQVAKEDAIGSVRHDFYLEIDVNVIEGEPNILEVAMCFGDSRVGGFHLQCLFYL